MTRIVCVTAGKGGVGKTTTVSNLGSALSKMGKDVTVVDTNLTTPNLSIHLGIPLYPITLHDVLKNQAYITEAMHIDSSGLRVIPGSLSLEDMDNVDPDNLSVHLDDLVGHTDLIFLDAAAGLGKETMAAMKAAHDVIIVANPDLPSVTDALKTKKLSDELGINILGVVVTRSTRNGSMSDEDIEDMLDIPIIAKIPEDKNIRRSISNKKPLVFDRPMSPAANAYKKLAGDLIGQKYTPSYGYGMFSAFKRMLSN